MKKCAWCDNPVDPMDNIEDKFGNYYCDETHFKKYLGEIKDNADNMAYCLSVDK